MEVCEWVKVVAARYKRREREKDCITSNMQQKSSRKFWMGFHHNTVLKYRKCIIKSTTRNPINVFNWAKKTNNHKSTYCRKNVKRHKCKCKIFSNLFGKSNSVPVIMFMWNYCVHLEIPVL